MCVFSCGEMLCVDDISFCRLAEEIDFLMEEIEFWVWHVATDILIHQVPKMAPPGRFLSKVYQAEQL